MAQPLAGGFQAPVFGDPGGDGAPLAVDPFYILHAAVLAGLGIDEPVLNRCRCFPLTVRIREDVGREQRCVFADPFQERQLMTVQR